MRGQELTPKFSAGNSMEIHLLKYFLEAANELNITRAAHRLHMAQPALSKQLGKLERETGRVLFVREKYGIRLTNDGILLRKRAQEIIDLEAKTLAELAGTDSVTITGTVYIGAGETPGVSYIGKVLREIRAEYPGIDYRMISGDFEDISMRLGHGLIDFALFVGKANFSDYEYISLPYSDRWGAVVRDDDELANHDAITPEDIRGRELLFSHQAQTHGELSEWLGLRADRLNITGTHNLAYNASIIITIEGIVNTGADSGLKFIPLMPEVKAGLVLAWKKDALLSKAAQKFRHALKASFSES